ncbi:DUF2207 domain-containing protein [Gulosibacter sp. 10]|uniref:DUF2207 family protein n=1 Tax=Gulosibacter sp. 10 TaxID=1255570 RepID=UPI00097EA7AC|nr:DUF2207 domain-containing protein [Gulosibacter sp. 10]SJM54903.1 putative membrane protein [Gulosibacter sp. 10]
MTAARVRRPHRSLAIVLCTILLAALAATLPGAASARADVEDFTFSSWTVEMDLSLRHPGPGAGPEVHTTSVVEVTETVVADFPEHDQNRGIIRSIPLALGDGQMLFGAAQVFDEHGDPVPFESSHGGGEVTLEIGDDDYVHGETTYVIEYSLSDVIATIDDESVQEFYPNLLPTEHPQTIEQFAAEIRVDAELAGAMLRDASCYRGAADDSSPCELEAVELDDGGLAYSYAAGPLAADETVTVDLGFEPGTVPELTLFEEQGWRPYLIAAAGPATALAALILLLFQFRASRHARGGTVIPRYEPDEELPPHLAARLIPTLQGNAFPAAVLWAGVNGVLQIEEGGDEPGDGKDALKKPLLRKTGSTDRLHPLERRFVDTALFIGDGGTVSLDANETVGKGYERFTTSTADAAVDEGLLAESKTAMRARSRTLIAGAVAVVAAVVATILLLPAATERLAPWAIGAGIAAIAILIVGACVPVTLRTDAGAAAKERLDGLREYMKLSEAERLQMLQGAGTAERVEVDERRVVDVYERLLPYAVLLGLERSWTEELQHHYEQADYTPAWLPGQSMQYFPLALANVRTAADSSASVGGDSGGGASASGFGGGGFAGGGFGGGSVGGR